MYLVFFIIGVLILIHLVQNVVVKVIDKKADDEKIATYIVSMVVGIGALYLLIFGSIDYYLR